MSMSISSTSTSINKTKPIKVTNPNATREFIVIFCISLVLTGLYVTALVMFIARPSPEISFKPDTTTITLNFTADKNLKVEAQISLLFSNPNSLFDVFFNNTTFSIYYNATDHNPTTQFLTSLDLPSLFAQGYFEGFYTTRSYGSSIVNNSIIAFESGLASFFVKLSTFLSFNDVIFFPHQKGYVLNLFCYPLSSQVSSNVTTNTTTVLLDALSCK